MQTYISISYKVRLAFAPWFPVNCQLIEVSRFLQKMRVFATRIIASTCKYPRMTVFERTTNEVGCN